MTFVLVSLAIIIVALTLWRSVGWNSQADLPRLKSGFALGFGLVALAAHLFVVVPAMGEIDAGQRGVVLRFGAVTGRIIEPGLYFLTPFVESVVVMDATIQAEAAKAEGASIDLQVVHTEVTINYSLDPRQAASVYENVRQDAVARIIRPAIQEAVKASTAKFKAEELITKRQAVKDDATTHIRERLAERGFILEAVNVTDFDFSNEFNAAIEGKTTALQLAAKANNDLERVKAEAQQQIEMAKGQAEALRVQKEAVSAELIQLRQVEALKTAIEKWDGKLPATWILGGDGAVPLIAVEK